MAIDADRQYDLPICDNGPIPNALGKVRCVGTVYIPAGIIAWVHTLNHELGHQALFQQGGVYTFGPPFSSDGDYVDDVWEANHGLDNTKSDSTEAYNATPEPADDEILADVAALPMVYANLSVWNQDWSSEGVQYGNLPPYMYGFPSFRNDLLEFNSKDDTKPVLYMNTLQDIVQQYPTAIVSGFLPAILP